jgi:hypothetical protein
MAILHKQKNSRFTAGEHSKQKPRLSHPDYTVGPGISPARPERLRAPVRGLVGLSRITAGVDLHHPPKRDYYIPFARNMQDPSHAPYEKLSR